MKNAWRSRRRKKSAAEFVEQRCGPHHEPRLDQRGLHRQVFRRFAQAVVDAAHARADLEAHVPTAGHECFELDGESGIRLRVGAVGQQQQHIDVRVREQLAPAKAADRDQRERRVQPDFLPDRLQGLIGQCRQPPQRAPDDTRSRRVRLHRREQCGFRRQVVAPPLRPAGRWRAQHGGQGSPQPAVAVATETASATACAAVAAVAGCRTKSGTGGLPADTVNTS